MKFISAIPYKNHFIFAIIIYLFISINSVGYHQSDEHFQINEFAAYKLKMIEKESLPWEYSYQMRPAFQVAIVYGLSKFLLSINHFNPFVVALILRIMSSILSLIIIFFLVRYVYENDKLNPNLKRWFVFITLFLWFSIYINVRFSSEHWSGAFILLSIIIIIENKKNNFKRYTIAGFFAGIAFICRYQVGFMITGMILWLLFIQKIQFKYFIYFLIGILLSSGIGILVDYWFYDTWTVTSLNYFYQNLVLDKVSGFGTEPWYYYFVKSFIKGIPPFSLLFILPVSLLIFYSPKSLITWTITPFMLIHFFIGRKDLRFMFPLIVLLPLVYLEIFNFIKSKNILLRLTEHKSTKIFIFLFIIQNSVATVFILLSPAKKEVKMYSRLYKYEETSVLFYLNDNPYCRGNLIQFYKRDNLELRKIKSITEIKKDDGIKNYFIIIQDDTIRPSTNFKIEKNIYSNYPLWIENYNINNWMSRVNNWKIYKIIF